MKTLRTNLVKSRWLQDGSGFFMMMLLLLMLPEVSRGENLLRNGGFERWTSAQGAPTGWRMLMGQTDAVMRQDTAIKHSGAASLRVAFSPSHHTCWPGQEVADIHPDTEYKLTGWVRVSNEFQGPFVVNVEPNLGYLELKAGADWAPWECKINSREAATMMVSFRLRGAGSVWLDDLSLVQTGEAGKSVLPERREMLKLLEYQAHPVLPSANTEDWTRPYRSEKSPQISFNKAAKPGLRPWKVGQWVRYLCRDNLVVPSKTPDKRPLIALVDCAIVGKEKVDGKIYFWYQSVVRLDKYWAAKASGLYETNEKILLDRKRTVIVSLLVEGPEFRDIRRYQLKVDAEPLLEYTDGIRAVLPALNLDHALIRPKAGGPSPGLPPCPHPAVPVTGALRADVSLPHLERKAEAVNWGEANWWGNGGAQDERRGEKPQMIRLQQPPFITVAFDGFGELKHYREMLTAGAGAFHHVTVPYLGEARSFFNAMPAYFSDSIRWDVDIFDVCRSNFRGFAPHLDEPYQRQRKRSEYIKHGETTHLAEAGSRYSLAVKKLIEEYSFWSGQTVPDYNCPASAAWYSARAGASGFILENARLQDHIAEIARAIGRQPERAFVDELNIACMRGAAVRFGTWWGQGLYRWTPEQFWKDELIYCAERGAMYHGFWIDGGEGMKDPALEFYQRVLKVLPDMVAALRKTWPQPHQATALILVPDGCVIGFAGADPVKPWGIIDFPQGKRMTEDVYRKAYELFTQGVAFDIAVNDPAQPPDRSRYQTVVPIE
ncbi:MAG: hypothetical protein HY360_21795 [Verrucomicrobia bacterium]|nr:hypothetical protein [Verrucomicrobiota bacterium]